MRQRYAAFLSYSHNDRIAARRLQALLEAYRVPEPLVGTQGAHGPVPPRLRPIFRDEEDMAASGDLTESVAGALAQSEALVVLCSPAAARSTWVAEEVRRFKARAGPSRVFALVISGTPYAADTVGETDQECLPLPLRRVVTAEGVVSDRRAEPLVVDVRAPGGAHHARMRLVAGMLGVPVDALVHRENGRRTRRLLGLAAALALALALTGALAVAALRARDAARAERAEAERLIGFMLGDLRGRLEKLGRLDLMDAIATRTLGYYERHPAGGLGTDSLANRAKALQLLGELRMARGDLAAAQGAFADAAAATGKLTRLAPDNAQRLFDHAQSEFWLGAVAFERGENAEARPHMEAYARTADRLAAMDPERAKWRAEVAHSRVNLGVLALAERDATRAASLFRQAAAKFAQARQRDPRAASAFDHAQALAWLADSLRLAGDLPGARAAREDELRLHNAALRIEGEDTRALSGLAVAHHALGEIALDAGDTAGALLQARRATAISARLRDIEPRNRRWSESHVQFTRQLGLALAADGDLPAAARTLDRAADAARVLHDLDPAAPALARLLGSVLVARAEVAAGGGDADRAAALAREATAVMPPPEPGAGESLAWWARAQLALGEPPPPVVADVLLRRPGARSLAEDCLITEALGPANPAATAAAARLLAAGFRNPRCAAEHTSRL